MPTDLKVRDNGVLAAAPGTIWGPHVARAAGQPADDRTLRYSRITPLSCENAYSNVLGVKRVTVRRQGQRLILWT